MARHPRSSRLAIAAKAGRHASDLACHLCSLQVLAHCHAVAGDTLIVKPAIMQVGHVLLWPVSHTVSTGSGHALLLCVLCAGMARGCKTRSATKSRGRHALPPPKSDHAPPAKLSCMAPKLQAYGAYNWTVLRAIRGDEGVYAASSERSE